jgi:hypothetical protein
LFLADGNEYDGEDENRNGGRGHRGRVAHVLQGWLQGSTIAPSKAPIIARRRP